MAGPTLNEFMEAAGPAAREAGASDRELRRYWAQTYSDIHPSTLPNWDTFKTSVLKQKPDLQEQEVREYWEEQYGDFGARESDQGDFVRGAKETVQQIPQLLGGLKAGAGAIGEKVAGEGGFFTALKHSGLDDYRRIGQDIAKDAKPSDSISEAYNMARSGDAGALVDWFQHALGYAGGQAVQMLATAGVGYVGGKLALGKVAELATEKMITKEAARLAESQAVKGLTADELRKQDVSNIAGKIGMVGAMGATAVGMEGGEIYGGLVEKAAQENRPLTGEELAKATGATLVAGGLEFVGDRFGLNLILGKSVASKLAASRLGGAAVSGTAGAIAEGGTEFTQTLIEEFGKGNDPFSPESIKQAIDASAMGAVGGGAVGTVGGLVSGGTAKTSPVVTERQSEDLGIGPNQATGPIQIEGPSVIPQLEGPIRAGEMRDGTVYGDGAIAMPHIIDVSPILGATSLDDAIAQAAGALRGPTQDEKNRAAEFARMRGATRDRVDQMIANAPVRRDSQDIPILQAPESAQAGLLDQPSPITPGQAFTPRQELPGPSLIETERARLVDEANRLGARPRISEPERAQSGTVNESTAPLLSARDAGLGKAYASVDDLHRLADSKGIPWDNNPLFMELTRMTTGKWHLDDLTPTERDRLAAALNKIQPTSETTTPPAETSASQGRLSTIERPSAPVTVLPEAQVPRSELPPEKNAEVLLRAEKAQADMEIAGTERGGRFHVETSGQGGTTEVVGLKSPTAGWYKDLTSGPSPMIRGDRKQSAREKIEEAIGKIIQDQGADRGKAVEQVKAALLQDREFHQTPWGRDLESVLQGEWPSWIEKPEGVSLDSKTTKNTEIHAYGNNSRIDLNREAVPDQQERVEQAAHVAATSPKNDLPEPTEGQKEAGNYQKGHIRISGLDISVENPAGSERSGKDPNGTPWSQTLQDHYGYVRGTKGNDKDHLDIFVKPGTPEDYNGPVFVVDQTRPDTGRFDEHKIVMGSASKDDARELYLRNYAKDWNGIRSIKQFTMPEFKLWLKAGDKSRPANATAEPQPKNHGNTERVQAGNAKKETPPAQDFELTAPQSQELTGKGRESTPKSEQLSIDVPPPIVGERPIIGREAQPEEAPLFSKNAQTADEIQTPLPESPSVNQTEESAEPPSSPTEILASALRTAADQIEGKPAAATLDSHDAMFRRIYEGEVTAEEFKSAFQRTVDGKASITAELNKLTKDQLTKRIGRGARSGDKKESMVNQAWTSLLHDFALGEGVSYNFGEKNGFENSVKRLVDKTTDETLKKYADRVAKNTADYKARVEGFLNPKTLEDFDTRVRIRGESSLNPEELARYDELLATAGRAKRQQVKEDKATVQGVDAGTDLQMVESKHTKTGEALWVVKLANRVDRSVYDRLNQAAHKLGGRYSSYNKGGAVPGFTFRSKEAAESFMSAGKGETVSAAPIRQAQQAEKQDNAVSRLREMADRLEGKADDTLNANRKTNTARRARMASSAENAAHSEKALASTMRNLADAIESGEATHLGGIRTKAQIEMLDSMIEQAKNEKVRNDTKDSYVDYERQKQRKSEPEDAAHANFPAFNFYKDDLHGALNALKAKPATERLRMRLTKTMSGVKEGGKVAVAREDAELALSKLTDEKHPGSPFWQWREAAEKLTRLESMGITSLPELRAALREFVEYRGKRGTIDKAKQLERNLIGAKNIGNDFFPTPKAMAQRMVAEADIQPGMKVLEPSAGNGNIAEAIRDAGVNPDVVEVSSALREILDAKGLNVVGHDFMDLTEGGYDRIVMNPPFSNGQDAEHIQHAYSLLKPGGKLVAIAGEGVFFRNDAKASAFRAWMEEKGGTEEALPPGTFNDASLMATTGANARMVMIEKPLTDEGRPAFEEREQEDDTGAPTMEQFKAGWTNGKPIGSTQKKIIDSSQQYPDSMMEALAKKPYVKQLVQELDLVLREMASSLRDVDPQFGRPKLVGLSPDDYYTGVNLRGPDAVILNPWGAYFKAQRHIDAKNLLQSDQTEYTAGMLLKTLIHEATHQQVEGHGSVFEAQLERNYAILTPERLARWQRRIMRTLEGQTDEIARDLSAQQTFWTERNRLPDEGRGRDAESRPVFNRQNVAGEGTRGRTGPPEDLFGSRTGQASPLDESAELRGRSAVTGTIPPTQARAQLDTASKRMRPYLLGALTLEQLSQVYGHEQAEVRQYNEATQNMKADFTEMSRGSEAVVKAWTALKIPVADEMAKVMEAARFLNFDPDPRSKQDADSTKKRELRTQFEALPGEAQSTYRLARDFYTDMAEERFEALKERIQRAGGTPENTKKLVDRLHVAYDQVRSKVYFPFTRFGENIVVAKKMENGAEKDREVHAFESPADAHQFATMMKLKGWTVKQTVAKEYSLDREGPASKIVRQMHDLLQGLDEGPNLPGMGSLKEMLMESLNQSFLQALPDMSYAKHFIHAKDVKGASKDALRAFAHSALHGAHHISRIRHADRLTAALATLDKRINETAEGDVTESRQVYNELIQRHNEILNPSTHPVAAWLGQLGFTMSLGGVVATGVTNATQVPLIAYPWLGARFGFNKAAAALGRAYKDFLDPKTLNTDSLFDASKSQRISESERKMLLELARRGHIDMTQTMDLAGLSSQDNLSRVARMTGTTSQKVMRLLGFTFHAPEVMNRQVTALAAFRLQKGQGGSYEESLQRAEQAIKDTQFVYTADNRPRYMSGNVLRVLTMFKQYSQHIAYAYGRAAAIWMDKNTMSQEERTVAKRQLLSMLALQYAAAGALGMPFFGAGADLLMSVVAAFTDDDDEKRDWEVALRTWLAGGFSSLYEAMTGDADGAEDFGRAAGSVLSHGASRLTPWDLSSRLGQQDLFFRAPQREREGRQAVMDWMTALGGPVPGYATNLLLGIGDIVKGASELNAGYFLRGAEEMTPAVLRNGLKSLRYTIEDVRTRDQYKQLELRPEETFGQLFGFTPNRVAEMYESTTAIKNKEHRILNQRKALLDRFARAYDDRDADARQKALDAIHEFNQRNRMFEISSNTLNRSLRTRAQHERGMERGMYLPRRRRGLLQEGEFGDF